MLEFGLLQNLPFISLSIFLLLAFVYPQGFLICLSKIAQSNFRFLFSSDNPVFVFNESMQSTYLVNIDIYLIYIWVCHYIWGLLFVICFTCLSMFVFSLPPPPPVPNFLIYFELFIFPCSIFPFIGLKTKYSFSF